MMKKISLITMAFLAGEVVAGPLKPVSRVVDLGQVQFMKSVTGVFELQNTSRKSVSISKVDTGCGCAVARFPQHAVDGGHTVPVEITYDSRMMGHFNKLIEVYVDGQDEPETLELRGIVVEKVEEFAGNLPFKIGQLTADCNYIEFENVRKGEILQQKFHIFNPTSRKVQPQVMHLPEGITADVSPSVVQSNHTAEVTITLDSRKVRDYGLTSTRVYLGSNPGERVASNKEIGVAYVLLPAVKEMTESEKVLAPHLLMSALEVYLPVADGKKKSETLELQNTGKSDLDIQSLQMFTEGMGVQLNRRLLKPGETAKMKITVHPKEMKKLRTNPRILMITNDPDNSKVVINVNVR